jgi:nitrilase/aliphatic nitrilase
MPSDTFEFGTVRCAAVQAAPAFLDQAATLDLVARRTAEAAARGAEIVAFPEAFVPGFPTWALVLAPTDQHELTAALYRQAVEVPGPATEALAAIALEHSVVLSVGVTERSRRSVGTMWNANLLFDADGTLRNHRRKLVPTWAEKLVWSNGDGHDLQPVATRFGRIGALICGENTNPLARFAMIDRGEQIHIASYPPAWPTRRSSAPGGYDLTHAVTLRSSAHAFEGKVVTIVSSALLSAEELDAIAAIDASAAEDLRAAAAPVSMVVGPTGNPVEDPLVGSDGIVVCSIDLADAVHLKQIHDVSGGYQRFDVFSFGVDDVRRDTGGI